MGIFSLEECREGDGLLMLQGGRERKGLRTIGINKQYFSSPCWLIYTYTVYIKVFGHITVTKLVLQFEFAQYNI